PGAPDDPQATKDGGGGSDTDGGGGNDASAGGQDGGNNVAGPTVDRSDPKLHEFGLNPKELDPTVKDHVSVQYAQLDTRATPIGRLVVFLPGYTNPPGAWRDHGRKLAEFGFHVMVPYYNNDWPSSACNGMGSSCNTDTRWEALVGEDTSGAVNVARADSAEGRVVTMLKHLRTAHPGGDWGYYLDGSDNLRYGRVIIAGISHGASSAGLYATRRPFARVVMHSGGAAGDSKDPMTPLSEWYGLSHTGDGQHAAHLSAWSNSKMLGSPTSIDGKTPPYGSAHQLITSEASSYPHCSVAVHSSSPPENTDTYIFEPAWRYMYAN
ncbi:MAG: hypothetical protein KC416_13450, partial [Myxococcales bacterium]|nr:hypothetical protein [Myxococcales bacterium]